MMNYDKETCEAMEHMMNDASEKAEENADPHSHCGGAADTVFLVACKGGGTLCPVYGALPGGGL